MSKRITMMLFLCVLLIGITPLLGLAFSSSIFTLPSEYFALDDGNLLEIIAPPHFGR